MEGYRWRDEQAWAKCAQLAAYIMMPWSKETPDPRAIFAAMTGTRSATSDSEFERLAGLADPAESFDAMVTKQTERKRGA